MEKQGLTKARDRNLGLWSAGGALTAAILSSACCWLPFVLIGVGVSTTGIAGLLEAYRVLFLVVTVLLLGAGFYFVYVRKPKCAPDETCPVPNPRLQRFNRVMLWISTALVLGFATFPSYVGHLVGGPDTAVSAQVTQISRTYGITGMTCEGCAARIEDAVEETPAVVSAQVSYGEGTLRVHLDPDARLTDAQVIAAVEALGYHARRESAE